MTGYRPYAAINQSRRQARLEEAFFRILKIIFFVAWLVLCAACYYVAAVNLDPSAADYRQAGVDRAEVVGRWAE